MKNIPYSTQDLLLLAHIVRAGSLSAAAKQLGMGRSAISKRLMALENTMGSRLLQRTTRKMSLTQVGEEILFEAHKIERALLAIDSISENHQQQYSGNIKVSCSSSIGRNHLIPILKSFTQRYPGISINLQLEDRFVDLIQEQVDVSIRIGHLADSTLIAKKMGQLTWQLCASPDYIARAGQPGTPAELRNHACIYYQNSRASMNTWEFNGKNGEERINISGPLAINDADALVKAAIDGLGILLIDYVIVKEALDSGKLIPILPHYPPAPGLPVYAVYPAREFVPARVTAFIHFILEFMSPRL